MKEQYRGLLASINPETHRSRISCLVGHGNGKNVVQVEKGKYSITEGFVASVCDSFGIVHHGIKQFIRRCVLYATSRVSRTGDMRSRARNVD